MTRRKELRMKIVAIMAAVVMIGLNVAWGAYMNTAAAWGVSASFASAWMLVAIRESK